MLTAPLEYKKMYVMVNQSKLTLQQSAVQAGHAIAEFMALYGNEDNVKDWCLNKQHRTLILISAKESDMIKMMAFYDDLGLKHQSFNEPDLNNMLTAVAFEPVWTDQGAKLFKKFKLI